LPLPSHHAFCRGGTTAQAADDISHCDKELVPTVVNSNANVVLRMFASKLVTDENYQEIKNDLGTSGGYGLAWGSADAHGFQEQNHRHLDDRKFDYGDDETRSYLTTFLPQNVTDKWLDCIALLSTEPKLLLAGQAHPGEHQITLRLRWIPGQYANDEIKKVSTTINGAELPFERFPKNFSKGEKTIVVTRDPNKPLIVVVNGTSGGHQYTATPYHLPIDHGSEAITVDTSIEPDCTKYDEWGFCSRCTWTRPWAQVEGDNELACRGMRPGTTANFSAIGTATSTNNTHRIALRTFISTPDGPGLTASDGYDQNVDSASIAQISPPFCLGPSGTILGLLRNYQKSVTLGTAFTLQVTYVSDKCP